MILAIAFILITAPVALARNAEFNAIPETGIARLILDLQKLPVSGTVMQVGAHPDDEDNALLAYLSKGRHLNAYYLVSNYGEGGQNEIGPELYEALGVLRSQELAAARAIDGATQLYLGAYDFGYSKSGAEALAKWGHEEYLGRMVRMLRLYRPDIVLTHHDTVSGHGQHQAVGTLILEAFDAAADPKRFPDQIRKEGLQPWQVKKLYVSDKNPTLQINAGEFNPVPGRSYHEIGMLARSMHKSQGMAGPGLKGDQIRSYKLVKSTIGTPGKEKNMVDGVDISLNAITEGLNEDPAKLAPINHEVAELDQIIQGVLAGFNPSNPSGVAKDLLKGLELVRQLENEVASSTLSSANKAVVGQRLSDKERDFVQAARDMFATSLDVVADDPDVIPGQTFTATVALWNRGEEPVENVRLALNLPSGWIASGEAPVVSKLDHNKKAEAKFKVTVPANASYTGAFDAGPVQAVAGWQVFGAQLATRGAAEVRAVPAVAVSLNPEKLMVPVSNSPITRTLSVKLRNNAKAAVKGQIRLALPKGWTIAGSKTAFAMTSEGEETSVPVGVTIPGGAKPGAYTIQAAADYDGGSSNTGYQIISYPHIDARYLDKPAETRAAVIDVKLAPNLKVGYVSSGFDNVPDYLGEMGVNYQLLTADDLTAGDLSRYDTIILGIRAYLNRPDLVAHNPRLLEYVKNGGNLIVQYHKTFEWKPEFAPFPIVVGSNRVTVEEAPMTVLDPKHILFNAPNKIVAQDWDGWIQERGLYFPDKWADEYSTLVSCNDPNEPEQKGAWLIAGYGKGTYIYTALVWYRQLDSLVPGGYRIFANMISLPKMR
ncbi:MAG: NEW3 domain-containing protein [Firmicutes bacterium]|nr:NEW3 domain-containing protein [Bacillota bacterium]